MTWLYLGVAILAEVSGTLALRQSHGFRHHRWTAAMVLGYVVAFSFLDLTLRSGLPVGIAYGIWAAVGIVLTAVAGRVLFQEPLTPTMAFGMAVIISGVLLIELGGQ